MELVQIHDNWAFRIDNYNNHMLFELKKFKVKGSDEEKEKWIHDGKFFNNHKQLFEHLFKTLRNREFEGEGLVPMEEFLQRLDQILVVLGEMWETKKYLTVSDKGE